MCSETPAPVVPPEEQELSEKVKTSAATAAQMLMVLIIMVLVQLNIAPPGKGIWEKGQIMAVITRPSPRPLKNLRRRPILVLFCRNMGEHPAEH